MSLALFKYVWNTKALRIIVNGMLSLTQDINSRKVAKAIVSLQMYAALLNNILIPCMVVAVIDPNCFHNFLVAAPKVKGTSEYPVCLNDLVTNDGTTCIKLEAVAGTTSYQSPFTYS